MLTYLLYRLAATLAPVVPTRPGYRAAAAVADLLYLMALDKRRLITGNLRRVVGERVPARQLHATSRRAFRNLVWNYFELFRIAGGGLAGLRANTRIDGLEYLTEAAAHSDTGVVVAFGHVGNIEAFSQVTMLLPEHRFLVVVERMADRRMHELLSTVRRRQGLELVPADEPARVLRQLRAGCHAIICADLDTTGTGTTVEFFGAPMRAPVGAARLALLTGAPLLVVAGWREDFRRPHRLHAQISPPLPLPRGNGPRDVQPAVQCVVRAVEAQVAARPEQWLAFRKVWTGT